MHAVTGMIRNMSMLRRKTHSQSQPTISLPVIEHPIQSQSEEEESNRTSVVSVEEVSHVSSKGYEITDGGNSNMKVVIRVRPENQMEMRSNCETVVKILDDHVLVFDPKEDNDPGFQGTNSTRKRRALLSRKRRDLRFAFDRVFDENSTQNDVFEHTTKSVITGLLDGVNCSVFAYGATGAGKTHTMLGSLDNPGVMFLTTMELYRRIDQLKHEKNCQIAVTYLEVYNETIKDLLSPSGPLPIREDSSKGLVVSGLTQHQPSSAEDLLQMLENGNKNRTQHPTDANATSSRSHAVFQVYVNQRPCAAGLSAEVTQGKMSLIDLAGSERATVTTNRGARFREGANINKSLLALGNCINALASNKGKTGHVPYRNSKLTRLLKDSLGGNCKTVMIANVSPSSLTYEDTYNTLKYADRAKQIKTKLVRNVVNVDYHVSRYRTIVIGLQKEIEELKSQLQINNHPSVNLREIERLKTVVGSVYGVRTRLRKNMADLDAAERDTLLRALRKERELQRIEVLTGDDKKMSKIKGKLDFLHNHLQDIKEQKTVVHLELSKNNTSIGKALSDINSTITSDTDGFDIMRSHIDLVLDSSKLEAENSYQWKQTKHLLKYIKNQEKDISRTEKLLTQSLELVCKQYQLLQATHCSTPVVHDLYNSLVRQIEGEKEVGWTDHIQDQDSLHDVSVSSFAPTHQALMDTIIAHSSPLRKMGGNSSRYSSPINSASLGLLTVSTGPPPSPLPSRPTTSPTTAIPPKSPLLHSTVSQSPPHPLSNRLVATPDHSSPSEQRTEENSSKNGFAGKVLSSPMKSTHLMKRHISTSSVDTAQKSRHDEFSSKSLTPTPEEKTCKTSHSSPMTSPKLKVKRVVFNSPPPSILEVEDETDFEESNEDIDSVVPSAGSAVTKSLVAVPPTPPVRVGDVSSTKEAIIAFTEKKVKVVKANIEKKAGVTKAEKSPPARYSASPVGSKNTPPSKYRINLAELTSIQQSTYTSTSSTDAHIAKQSPTAPTKFQSSGFENDFVASYPACSTRKVQHTPVGKSLSIDNPTYASQSGTTESSLTPCKPYGMSMSPRAFRPLPNQHPAFPPPPPQRVYPSTTASPVPQKPAFLPVSKSKTTPKIEYRSPVNIPVQPLPSLLPPPPPIPSPSTVSKSRSTFKSSSSASSCSQLSDSLTQRQGFVLHPALVGSGGSTLQLSKTSRSHRYSLTSPTQARDSIFTSSKEKENSVSTVSSDQKSDPLNSTFTISRANKEKRKYAVLEQPMHSQPKSTKTVSQKKTSLQPLTVLQVGMTDSTESQTGSASSTSSTEKKLPNYLTLTKSAAFKKVHKVTHQMKNQKENYSVSNGMVKSQSMKVKVKPLVNRSTITNNRSHSVSAAAT